MLMFHGHSYVRWMAIRGGMPTVGVYVKCYCFQKNKFLTFHKTVKPHNSTVAMWRPPIPVLILR